MSKHSHPSAGDRISTHFPALLHNPSSSSSTQGKDYAAAGSPPPQTMAGFGDDISGATTATATKPLTMFYNGNIAVFNLPQDKAEDIMKMAAGGEDDGDGGGRRRHGAVATDHAAELLTKMREEMPIASKRSLQRFFQKRKERLHRP